MLSKTWVTTALSILVLCLTVPFVFGEDEPSLTIPRVAGKSIEMAAPSAVGSANGSSHGRGPEVSTSDKHDLSLPLTWMPIIQAPAPKVILEIANRQLPPKAKKPDSFRDSIVQNSPFSTDIAVTPNIPSTTVNFDGVDNRNGVLPPDTNGAVGPNHYVQTVNLSYAVYNKDGSVALSARNTNTLWQGFGGPCETTNNGDPVVIHDQLANRWLISQFALPNPYYQCIAISQTANPTGAYFRYQFLWSSTELNDYPHFGLWPDGYYVSIHEFTGGASYAGEGNGVFERDKMLLGQTARLVAFHKVGGTSAGGQLPSDLDGSTLPPAGAPNVFVEPGTNNLIFRKFHVDWNNTANSTLTVSATVSVAAFDQNLGCTPTSRDCIPQPSTTEKLDGISDRFMFRLAYRNFGTHEALVANHTVDAGTNKAGIRWYEIRNPAGASPQIFQQGTYSPDASHRWMGSIAQDGSGNIALGYSVSSSTLFPSIRYTGRLVGDPAGQLPQGEGTIIAGSGSQTHSASRWGDYSAMTVDPVDDCTFWYTTEYLQTTGSAPWRTRIASFKFPTCGGGGGCTAPSILTNNTAADVSACADSGVLVTWAKDAGNWGDGGTGTRTYDVLRNGSPIVSGIAYGPASPSLTDTTGVNGTTYTYSVRYKNGCGSNASTTGASAADVVSGGTTSETANQSGTLTAKNNTVTSVLSPAFTTAGASATSATATWTLGGNTTLTTCVAIRLRAPGGTETTLKAAGAANTGTANVLSFYQAQGPGSYTIVLQELAGCGRNPNRNATLTATKLVVQKPSCP